MTLALRVHASSWGKSCDVQEAHGAKGVVVSSCRFCGLDAPGWQELFHLNGDQDEVDASNTVSSCVLCHLPQHLDRPRIEQEASLIFLPGMSQTAINVLAREIHLLFAAHGEKLPIGDRRWAELEPELRAPYAAFKILESRAEVARHRFGTSSPRELGAALLASMRSGGPAEIGGLKLLPLGRYFRKGRDIYPDLLRRLR